MPVARPRRLRRLRARTLLLTHRIETIGEMSCNCDSAAWGRAILVREIDALDGVMGRAIDRAGIQFRTLNLSKRTVRRRPGGSKKYRQAMQALLAEQVNLEIRADPVADDLDASCACAGIRIPAHAQLASRIISATGSARISKLTCSASNACMA